MVELFPPIFADYVHMIKALCSQHENNDCQGQSEVQFLVIRRRGRRFVQPTLILATFVYK